MKIDILGKIVAVILFLAAFYTFDTFSLNSLIISILLFNSGIRMFLEGSRSQLAGSIKKFLFWFNLLLLVLLFLKMFLIG